MCRTVRVRGDPPPSPGTAAARMCAQHGSGGMDTRRAPARGTGCQIDPIHARRGM
eukprot:gene15877-19106_t